MNAPGLYFVTLEAKLAEVAAGELPPLHASPWGRRFFWGMVGGMLWTSAAPALLSPSFALNIVLVVGLLIEIVGIIGVAILQLRETLPTLRNRRATFAQRLDREFEMYREVVLWLRSHDRSDLTSRLVYVRSRRDMLRRKLGLFAGGIERLGVLPLLVVVYLQVHNFTTWPPQLTRVEIGAIWALVVAYGVGWWAAGAALRLDLYEQLIADAVEHEKGVRG
jgi:hypothetical protein